MLLVIATLTTSNLMANNAIARSSEPIETFNRQLDRTEAALVARLSTEPECQLWIEKVRLAKNTQAPTTALPLYNMFKVKEAAKKNGCFV